MFAGLKEQEGHRTELMKMAEKQRRMYEKKLREVVALAQKSDAAILHTSEENAALKQQASVYDRAHVVYHQAASRLSRPCSMAVWVGRLNAWRAFALSAHR